MSKILKLINDERKNMIIKTRKASSSLDCTYTDNIECTNSDQVECYYAVDLCSAIDYAICSGGSVDECTQVDDSGCMEKHYDSCTIDTSFCSEAEKYDFEG